MDRERLERCLEQVLAYRASGLKPKMWAQANGVSLLSLLSLQSWCAHAGAGRVELHWPLAQIRELANWPRRTRHRHRVDLRQHVVIGGARMECAERLR